MSRTAPPVYLHTYEPPRLRLAGRLIAAVVACGCLGVLVVATLIRPDASGVGTHTQLGINPCEMVQRTGLPCPTCGQTTSFAYFVRGRLGASLYVQPMGAVLAALTAMLVWAGAYIAITGRPVHRLLRVIPARWWMGPLLTLAILAWMWKIWIHLRGADGWG